MPLIERDITLTCVSQRGRRPLRRRRPLARRAGSATCSTSAGRRQHGATRSCRPTSTASRSRTPLEVAHRRPRRDGRDRHEGKGVLRASTGFPARLCHARPLRIRGRHQVAGAAAREQVRRRAGLLDQARLGDRRADQGLEPGSTPRRRWPASMPAARSSIGGVAWAQRRGIAKVEVSIDDGDWQQAELGPEADRRLLAPVVPRVGRLLRPSRHRRTRHHRGRRGPDRGPRRPLPRRRQRLAVARRDRLLTAAASGRFPRTSGETGTQ